MTDKAFDFDLAVKLAKENPREFEHYRVAIIDAHIKKLPLERRAKVYLFQHDLDLKRAAAPDEFFSYCTEQLSESLNNLDDQITRLRGIINGPPRNNA